MRRLFAALPALLLSAACATVPAPAPVPSTAPPRSPNQLTPIAAVPQAIAPPLLRVGLATDESAVSFERIEGGYVIVAPSGPFTIGRGFTVHAPLAGAATRWAVQVAALSDRTSADRFAERIRSELGVPATVVFNAAGGSYRVIAGDLPTDEEARLFRQSLIDRGYQSDIVVVRRPAVQEFAPRLRLVDDEGDEVTFDGESILILPAKGETLPIAGQPYRGGARLFVNNRGLLNVINELNLEHYVRGVVPNEMGPSSFPEIEALKAQALAARTYAISRLGDFSTEGYDICPTPACQVYRGFATEQPLSNQAVEETAGLILTYEGRPIDALYTSTCGGETSNVATMFPGRSEPYLRHVRCVELDLAEVAGVADSPLLDEMAFEARLAAHLLGTAAQPGRSWSARNVAAIVAEAMRLAGMPAEGIGAPASSRRGDVLSYLGRVWQLEEHADALILPEDRQYYFPLSDDDRDAFLAAAFMIRYRLLPAQMIDQIDLQQAMPREELLGIVASWLRRHDRLRDVRGKLAAIDGRSMSLNVEGERREFAVPSGIPLFRNILGRYQEQSRVVAMLNDRVAIHLGPEGTPVAAVIEGNYDGAAFDRTSSFASWVRSFRADELAKTISRRNPVTGVVDLRPVEIDEAHRVARLEVVTPDRVVPLEGIVIRWSLGLPDNLFTIDRSVDPDGMPRFTFFGKGWGHGTGMCQVGAYGMAFRGWSAERIVRHFYTGAEVTRYALAIISRSR